MLYKQTEIYLSDWTKIPLSEFLARPKIRRGMSYNIKQGVVEFCDLLMPRQAKPTQSILKITLEDNSAFYCTPELRVLKEDGQYWQARHLVEGTRLMGVKSAGNEAEYVVKLVEERDREMTPVMVSSIRLNNFAIGCGVFVHS